MLNPAKVSTYKGLLSNPGTRSTIPDAYLKHLSPGLFAKRQANRQAARNTTKANNNPLYDPTSILSGNALKNLVHKLAGLELNPQISAAKQELGVTKANDTALVDRIAGYNKQTNDFMSGVVRDTASSAHTLASDLANNMSTTLGGLKSDNMGDQQLSAADTALRGPGLGGGMDARLAGDYARQVTGTQATLGAQNNQGLVQATGWAGLAGVMAGASAMRGADNLATAANYGANREAKINNQISTLKASRGPLEAKDLLDLRKSEFEKAATAQTLGIKATSAQASATSAQASLINARKVPETAYQKQLAKTAVAVGLTPHAFAQLSPQARRALIKAAKTGTGKSGKSLAQINAEGLAREAASHGYTIAEWQKLSPAARQKIAAGSKAPKVKSPWLAPAKQNSSISDARSWYSKFSSSDWAKQKRGYKETVDHLTSVIGTSVAPGVINAIADKYILGHMTAGTKKMLAVEGIMPNRIAHALGVKIAP